jgi:hypothetical protein
MSSPGALRSLPRYFPLAAGGDLFLPYVKKDPHHQQGQFLVTHEASSTRRTALIKKVSGPDLGTTSHQDHQEQNRDWVYLVSLWFKSCSIRVPPH